VWHNSADHELLDNKPTQFAEDDEEDAQDDNKDVIIDEKETKQVKKA